MSDHTDVGAYALGLLEEPDRQAFEDHLAGCSSCAVEIAQFSPMADLLRGIDPVQAPAEEPPAAAVTDLLSRRAAAQRRRTRWQAALGAAAGIVLIGGGIGIGVATASSGGSAGSSVTVTGQLHSATDALTGVTGTVGLASKPWGTQVTMDLSKVRGPLECELVAVSTTGERRVVMGWLVPAAGYGLPDHPAHLIIEGGTSIPMASLASLTVDIVNGRALLTIPV
jgi:putative zinc finger protein